jgi:hypothetical protein
MNRREEGPGPLPIPPAAVFGCKACNVLSDLHEMTRLKTNIYSISSNISSALNGSVTPNEGHVCNWGLPGLDSWVPDGSVQQL